MQDILNTVEAAATKWATAIGHGNQRAVSPSNLEPASPARSGKAKRSAKPLFVGNCAVKSLGLSPSIGVPHAEDLP